MSNKSHDSNRIKRIPFTLILLSLLLSPPVFSQNSPLNSHTIKESDEQLLKDYISSKVTNTIVFDQSNIKQFWIEDKIVCYDNHFEIFLEKEKNSLYSSPLLKIQLKNVNETQDCTIEVITESEDFSYTVLNNKSKVIASSSLDNRFIQYNFLSALLHLENTEDFSFYLKFKSSKDTPLSIEKIILSFSNNKDSLYLASPGVLKLSKNNISILEDNPIIDKNTSFSVTGNKSTILAKQRIIMPNNQISSSVKIKNEGNTPTNILIGFAPYTKNRQNISKRNFPYKDMNQILTVLSSKENSDTIIVNSYPLWEKGCYLVMNAKEDLSDFPNFSFVEGTILQINKMDDGRSEIILDRPLKTVIKEGTKVRVQSKSGSKYRYTDRKVLNPGEEIVLHSQVKKDDSFFQLSTSVFSKGTYYVVPMIISDSTDSGEMNTITVSDFVVTY